jgi:hypothetical protein
MRTLGRRERAVCSLLFLAAMAMALPIACAGARGKATDPWRVLKDYSLSSVVWSPKGDHVAFVAAGGNDITGEEGAPYLRARIWLWSLPRHGQRAKLAPLAVVTAKQGIPAALFWLDDNRIGWAAPYYSERTNAFIFMQMGLRDRKRQRLVNRSFEGVQDASDGTPGPDDVYYDASSRTLLCSAGLTPNQDVYVRIIPLFSGKVRSIHVPYPGGLTYLRDGAYVSVVTLCGSVRNPQKPKLYLAAVFTGKGNIGWQLWRSDSYALRQDKVLVSPQNGTLGFPRTSPDGKRLLWLRYPEHGEYQEIVLMDLQSGKHGVLVKCHADYSLPPAIGCPYSWSPDGKQIAYADGSRVKIVKVPSDIGRTNAR